MQQIHELQVSEFVSQSFIYVKFELNLSELKCIFIFKIHRIKN